MARRRSTQVVAIGGAVFLAGAGLLFVGLRSGDTPAATPDPSPAATSGQGSTVVVQAGGTTQVPDIVAPKGAEVVAIQLENVPGLAGYARAGDHINLYATVKSGPPIRGLTPPYSKLVAAAVPVLEVTGSDAGGAPVFLLALKRKAAEKIIFFAKFESLWATLATSDGAGAGTPGRDYDSALSRAS